MLKNQFSKLIHFRNYEIETTFKNSIEPEFSSSIKPLQEMLF